MKLKVILNVILIGLILIINTISISAQQEAMYSQYMFNTLSVNPAYAGSLDALNAIILQRNQWLGFDGAPVTKSVTLHGPVTKKGLGMGFSVVQDEVGPVKVNNIFVDVSYKIKVHEGGYVSMGLKAGIDMRSTNLTDLDPVDASDPMYYADKVGNLTPNFGAGIYYHAKNWYFGASTPKLSKTDFGGEVAGDQLQRHYFIIGGVVWDINEDWKLRPSILSKGVKGAPASLDFTMATMYSQRVIGGLSYRFGDSFGVMGEVRIFQQLWLGYAHDFTVTDLRQAHHGTHEIMLYWDFNTLKTGVVKSPRFF